MSSYTAEASQLEKNKDKPKTANGNDDIKNNSTETKRKSTMTRRMSFSSRPWSSYAQNYSSCLSGLRRHSSEQLIKRQGCSLQSSPTSSSSDLTKSLDGGQLRNLKATTPKSEVNPKTSKISAVHARPFHQRRWSSPVAFSVSKLAPSSQQASKHLNEEDGSGEILQDGNKDKHQDKICETDEIILSQEQDKTPVSIAQFCVKNKATNSKATEKTSSESFNCSLNKTSLTLDVVEKLNNKANKEVDRAEPAVKMNGNQPRYTTDQAISDASSKSCEDNGENSTQSRNIYTEIKKNTKWSKSRRFRRRHHTIHADSRRFINPTLFTIAEQSSGSFGSVMGSGENEKCGRVLNGKLITRRSKSLGDLDTLSEDMKTKGVSVQQLCAKSISVSVASNENNQKNEATASKSDTTVTYKGDEKSESTSKRQTSCPVQVTIQTFNKIQITSGAEEQHKPQASIIKQYYSTQSQQHAVFTQPKAKWASITISQV